MGWQQEDAINEKHERSVLTSFVIIEKKLGKYNLRYETPTFDLNGNKIVWSSWSSFSKIFIVPGIYTTEYDIECVHTSDSKIISYDLVLNPGFYCNFEIKKTVPLSTLSNEYEDTS